MQGVVGTVSRASVIAALAIAVTVFAVGCATSVAGTAQIGITAAGVSSPSGATEADQSSDTQQSDTQQLDTQSSNPVSSDAVSSAPTAPTAQAEESSASQSSPAPTTTAASEHLGAATVDGDGIITVAHGSPNLTLDVYEDSLCPICGAFEAQFGQQIAKAIDDGQLTVRYHMVDFLNPSSASKTYSTRAYAALIAVAQIDGDKPGVFSAFHTMLFDSANQPKELAVSDLSNAQLADLAARSGASAATQKEIQSGTGVPQAATDAVTNLASLRAAAEAAGVQAGTPTVLKDGAPVRLSNTWLKDLLAG